MNKVYWVVEYMRDGYVRQTLIFAATKKEAGAGFQQLISVVRYR